MEDAAIPSRVIDERLAVADAVAARLLPEIANGASRGSGGPWKQEAAGRLTCGFVVWWA
jgi:hypothetical protein